MNAKKFLEKNKFLVIGFVSLGIISLLLSMKSESRVEVPVQELPASVDTLIPQGHILVPLELENIEQIGSLIGNSGVVDLYIGSVDQGKRKLIASRVKIIQAPYNPQVYAALIKESDRDFIQNYTGPFRAVVQNPTQEGLKIRTQENKKTFSISYQK